MSLLDGAPSGIGIEHLHGGCRFGRGRRQILLKQHPILVVDERHHSRVTVFRRVGDKCESSDHLPIHHVVLRTTLRLFALPRQHAEVVAVEGRVRVSLDAISFRGCVRRQWSERARGLPLR